MRWGAGLAAFALAATGCGVGPQRSPQDISRSAVPYGLLETTPPPALHSLGGQVRRTVFLVRGNRLVPATALVPLPGRIDQIVRVLFAGVSSAQSTAGLRSAIPDGTHLLSFDLTGRQANLDVSQIFTKARSADQILAVAQLVFTVTAGGTIQSVTFSVDNKSIEVPLPGGALATGPVTPSLYRTLLSSR